MTIKITTPNGGSDSLDFGCAQTAIVATVTGTEVSSGEGKLELKTTTGGTSATKATILANGRVGIGTATADEALQVNGAIKVTAGMATDTASTGAMGYQNSKYRFISWGADTSTKGAFGFEGYSSNGSVNGTHLSILANGNVGIGTSAPIAKLDVNSGDIAISSTQASDNGDLGEFQFWNTTNAGSGSGTSFVNDVCAIQGQMEGTGNNSGGSLHFYTKADGATKNEVMRLEGTGSLKATSPASTTGLQPFTIDWLNENNAGIMASIGCDRTASSAAPGDLVFSTSTSVDSGAISEKMRVTSAGLLKFNSGYGSAATAYGCRAWVNFNGQGTVAIRASGNVSSITDNGTGHYTVNFTTAMVDANYSVAGTAEDIAYGCGFYTRPSRTTSEIVVQTRVANTTNPALVDTPAINVQVFR